MQKLPPRYPSINKNKQEIEQLGFDHQDGALLTNSNGRRGRGRGGRGGGRGGRSRGRGGRIPRGIGSSSRIQFRDDNSVPYGRAPRKNARGGRNRGRGRGLRTVRPRQSSELSARSIPKANLLGSFSMLSKANHTGAMHSPESSGAEEWALERREYVKDDDDNSVSQSDESEEENGEPMNEEYDEQISVYPRDNSESSPVQMMDDASDDNDEDAEGDEGEEDGEDYEAEDPAGDEDDDVEVGGGDDIQDDDDDDGDGAANADEDEGDTSSYSSEYSE